MTDQSIIEKIADLVNIPVSEIKINRRKYNYKNQQFKVQSNKLYTRYGTCNDWIYFGILNL